MSIKSKKNFNNNIKKTFLTFFFMTIFFSNILTKENKARNLQKKRDFSSNSIYYLTKFPFNSVTGTGNELNDIPYRALCITRKCDSGCCVGKINQMQCGTAADCKTYNNYEYFLMIAPATLIPISILIFLSLFILLFTKRNQYSFLKSFLLAFICLGIITIPFVLYYARKAAPKKKKKIENKNKNK